MKNTSRQNGTKWDIKSLRIKGIIVAIALMLGFSADAQRFSAEYWHNGTVVLLDGTKLRGKIKYNFQQDLIVIQTGGQSAPYTAQNFLYFEMMDAYLQRQRRFYSLPYNPVNGHETPRMFEVLVEGKINLLAREEVEISSRNYGFGVYRIPDQNDLILSYFLLKQGDEIRPFTRKKSELFTYFGPTKNRMEDYMKEERLNPKDDRDLIRILSYYNSLFVNTEN